MSDICNMREPLIVVKVPWVYPYIPSSKSISDSEAVNYKGGNGFKSGARIGEQIGFNKFT